MVKCVVGFGKVVNALWLSRLIKPGSVCKNCCSAWDEGMLRCWHRCVWTRASLFQYEHSGLLFLLDLCAVSSLPGSQSFVCHWWSFSLYICTIAWTMVLKKNRMENAVCICWAGDKYGISCCGRWQNFWLKLVMWLMVLVKIEWNMLG